MRLLSFQETWDFLCFRGNIRVFKDINTILEHSMNPDSQKSKYRTSLQISETPPLFSFLPLLIVCFSPISLIFLLLFLLVSSQKNVFVFIISFIFVRLLRFFSSSNYSYSSESCPSVCSISFIHSFSFYSFRYSMKLHWKKKEIQQLADWLRNNRIWNYWNVLNSRKIIGLLDMRFILPQFR